jgi:hypothetical protein
LLFAHERSSLAVNARACICLVAVDVNRGGDHRLCGYGCMCTRCGAMHGKVLQAFLGQLSH